MTHLKLRRSAQLTLTADLRKALQVEVGDLLEARMVDGGLLLTPVNASRRRRAFERIDATSARVRDLAPTGDPLADEQEIAAEVRAARRERA